jgi:hypothetical protein
MIPKDITQAQRLGLEDSSSGVDTSTLATITSSFSVTGGAK